MATHWTIQVDDVDAGGQIFAHLTGAANDPITHPALAGKTDLHFRAPQIKQLAAHRSYSLEVIEVPPAGFAKVPKDLRFWVTIDSSEAQQISGRDRLGPYEPEAPANEAGQLVLEFRDPTVYQTLEAGLTYQLTFVPIPLKE